MALTITKAAYEPSGAARPLRGGFSHDIIMVMGEFLFDAAYASGGELLAATDIGLGDILFFLGTAEPSAVTGITQAMVPHITYNYDTGKVMAFGASGINVSYEVTHGDTTLTAYTVRFIAFGHKLS